MQNGQSIAAKASGCVKNSFTVEASTSGQAVCSRKQNMDHPCYTED